MQTIPPKRKKKKKWPWIVLVLVVVAAAAALVITGTQQVAQAYTKETAQRRDIVTYYSFSGNLIPITDEVQTAKDALKVKELYVAEGDHVAQGAPLLRGTDGTRVYAAYTGTVEELFAEVDDQLQPGTQIARIVDYDALEVSVDVDEYDVDAVTVGKQGDVYVNAIDQTVPGTVTELARDATTEGGVSYYEAKLQVEALPNVRSGMSVEVSLLNQQALGAVSISMDALSYDEYNRPFVYRMGEDGKLSGQYVETGVNDGKSIQIVSGLAEGDEVYYISDDMARFFTMRYTAPREGSR